MRLSVTPLIAETTTTTWSPRARYCATRAATFLIRSVLPTEVPPYFWTISAMGQLSVVSGQWPSGGPGAARGGYWQRTLESYHLHHRFLVWFDDDWFEASRLDRVVRVFQTVPGHGGGDHAALRDHSVLRAFDQTGQRRAGRRFRKNSFAAGNQFVGRQDFFIGHFINVAVGFLDRVDRALPARRIADANRGGHRA